MAEEANRVDHSPHGKRMKMKMKMKKKKTKTTTTMKKSRTTWWNSWEKKKKRSIHDGDGDPHPHLLWGKGKEEEGEVPQDDLDGTALDVGGRGRREWMLLLLWKGRRRPQHAMAMVHSERTIQCLRMGRTPPLLYWRMRLVFLLLPVRWGSPVNDLAGGFPSPVSRRGWGTDGKRWEGKGARRGKRGPWRHSLVGLRPWIETPREGPS